MDDLGVFYPPLVNMLKPEFKNMEHICSKMKKQKYNIFCMQFLHI